MTLQGKGYATTHRPQAIGNWFRLDRRNLSRSPKMPPEVEYAELWWKWWAGLQPDWRVCNSQGRPLTKVGSGDWEVLVRPGNNGMLVVLLSLVWWREVASDVTLSCWNEAVCDVSWVLDEMVKCESHASGSESPSVPW